MERRSLSIAKDLLADKQISVTAKLLFAQLLDHRNKQTGQCNPRRQTLARELGVSIPTISRALTELRRAGLILSKQLQHTASYEVQADQFDPPEPVSGGSKRSTWADQFDPPDPPVSLYEPIQVEPTRVRASVRAPKGAPAGSPQDQPQRAGPGRSLVPLHSTDRDVPQPSDMDPYDMYYAAILGSLRDRGRFLTATEERQLGNLMIMQNHRQKFGGD